MSHADANAHVAHQFEDATQQREAANLGMWIFLATEIMFFGGLFLAYTIYYNMFTPAFKEASQHLDIVLGGINTGVLITSSLTMAMAVWAAQTSRQKLLVLFLGLTLVLAFAFLGIKAVEYSHKFHDGLVPGPLFAYEGAMRDQVHMFFVIYFVMTGLHGVHVIIGIGIIAVILVMAMRGRFSAAYNNPVDVTGLYWHFVDIVWIFLFPLLYLLGRYLPGAH